MSDVYVLNRNNYKFNNQETISFRKIIETIKPILYDKKRKEGVILSSSASLQSNQLLYSIFGKNKKRAYELQNDFYELLKPFGQPKF
jgi:hypothetical protein